MSPRNALDINLTYLELKEGAEILFKDITIENLISFIQKNYIMEDVLELKKLSNSDKVNTIVSGKLK